MDVIQEPPIKRKRGVVSPSKYEPNRIKSSRSQGKEYVNYKGHVVHVKAIGNSYFCNTCEDLSLKIKNPKLNAQAKRVAVAEKIVHQRRAKKFYSTLKTTTVECQQRKDLAAFCFDFMQNLQLPEFPTQDKFYLSQLTVSLNSKVQFTVSKFRHLVYEEDNVVKVSEYINGFMWNTFTDLLQPRASTSCLQLPTEKAYKGPLPIGTVKLDNIKTLLR
ncbi:hypothetical protein RN001_001317 [Aquatica leii]|uniref:Uncharacterized protein n=1 Tax=Aquatica leii TaxID=1421715 RepID=A0AAN7SCN8_9COLE|nr:hypothetical protein RN001_001317 [Aquatica leii]